MRQGLYPGHFLQNSSIQTHQRPPGEGKAKAGNQTLGRGAVTPCLSQVHSPGSKSRRFSGVGVGGWGCSPSRCSVLKDTFDFVSQQMAPSGGTQWTALEAWGNQLLPTPAVSTVCLHHPTAKLLQEPSSPSFGVISRSNAPISTAIY